MALVTTSELSSYMSATPITTAQVASAKAIIEGVQNELEMYINRPLETRIARELVRTDTVGFARLRSAPILSVTKVSYVNTGSLTPLEMMDYQIDDLFESPSITTYDLVPANFGYGLITSGGVNLGSPNTYFVVEYTGGGGDHITQYLPSIKLAIMRVASREWQHLHDDTVKLNNGDIGDAVDPGEAKLRGWAPEELAKFDRIRRRVIV